MPSSLVHPNNELVNDCADDEEGEVNEEVARFERPELDREPAAKPEDQEGENRPGIKENGV